MLNVHHAYYEAGKKPWEYDNDLLVTWCEQCHKKRHADTNVILAFLAAQPREVANGFWTLAAFEFCSTLRELDPSVDDKDLSQMVASLRDAYYRGQNT